MTLITNGPRLSRSDAYWHLSGSDGRTSWPCLDYLIDCVDRQRLRPATVELRAYALKMWISYLEQQNVNLLHASDAELIDFASHKYLRQSGGAFGDSQARKRSINQIVRSIYRLYAWLQCSSYGEGLALLGPSRCQFISTLNEPGKQRSRSDFPCTFRFAGERSKHNRYHIPDDADRARMVEHFYSKYSQGVALRNALLLDIALSTGWRRGSIASLSVDQFSAEVLDSEHILVTPPEQKFGYTLSFSISSTLATRIGAYIRGPRSEIVRRTGTSSVKVFLSAKRGTPLTAAGITKVFSNARKPLGLPPGVGIHSWRRAFANRAMAREVERRRRIGVNGTFSDVAAVVASQLGHESLKSQEAYIRGHGSLEANDGAGHGNT